MPRSRQRSNMRSTSAWVKSLPHSPPSCQVPMPTTETRRLVLPSLRYFMARSLAGPPPHAHGAISATVEGSRMSDGTEQLAYAPPPALHRRRWVRRLLLRLGVVALAVAVGAKWGPPAWRRAELLYRQRQCLRYTAPPDSVVCAEPLPAAGRMYDFTFEAPDPPVADQVLRLNAGVESLAPGTEGPLLFMHERRAASGKRRLVIVRRVPASKRQSWVLPVAYQVTLVEPATATADSTVRMQTVIEVLPRDYNEGENASLRFFAGQPDPSDASRFTVRYQRGSRAGVLHGVLEDPPAYASSSQGGEPVIQMVAEEAQPPPRSP